MCVSIIDVMFVNYFFRCYPACLSAQIVASVFIVARSYMRRDGRSGGRSTGMLTRGSVAAFYVTDDAEC
ncbi:hypothetical protein ASD15_06620 [Massilia sp. Root351]|nr:hypothetical protein ASD15_06620 [Massilia sp. Root351]